MAQDKIDCSELAKVKIISEVEAVAPSSVFYLAIEIIPEKHWHTYWINPGDAGLASTVLFTLPENFKIIDTIWQIPDIFYFEGMANYGFGDKHHIFYKIQAPDNIEDEIITINAEVKWLVCKDVCLPGKYKVSITLKISDKSIINRKFKDIYTNLPVIIAEKIQSKFENDFIYIPIDKLANNSLNALFIPYEEGIINNGAEQKIIIDDNGDKYLSVELDSFRADTPKMLKGILKTEDNTYDIILSIRGV